MLEIIRPPEDNMKVPIAEEGLTEEFQPIEEMGRLRSWKIQSAPLTKEEYIALKNELEKPGFLQVTGKFLHPNQEKVLYLKCKAEIISLNEERDDIHYSIEFRLKDAEGLYGGAQDVTPDYSTVIFTFKDNTGTPIVGMDVEIYDIIKTTDENGVARFNNFYKLREFNFATGQWEYNEEELIFKVYGVENELLYWEDSLYIDQEQIEVPINLSVNEFTILDTNNNPVENAEIEIKDEIYLTTDINGQASFYTHSNETVNYKIVAPVGSNIWDINKILTAHNTYATSTYYDRTINYEELLETMNLDYNFGLEYEIMYNSIDYTVEDYESRQIIDYEVNLFDEHQVILPSLRELGFTEDENGRLQEDIEIDVEIYFGDNRVSSDDSFNIINAGGLTLTLNNDGHNFATLNCASQGSWTMEAPRKYPGCPAPPSSPISPTTALTYEEYPDETSWRTFRITMTEDGVGDASLFGIPTFPSSLNEYLSTDCRYWDDVNEEYVYYSFSDDSQSCSEQHSNGNCVGINYKTEHSKYGVYDDVDSRRYITGIDLDQPITIGKFNGKVRNIKVKKNGTVVGEWDVQSAQPYSRNIQPITGNLKAQMSKGTVAYFWVDWQKGNMVENALIEAETASPPDIAQQKSTTTDVNGEGRIVNMILDDEIMEYTISKTGYEDVSHLMKRKSNEFFKNKISDTEDFVLSSTFDKFNNYINESLGGDPTEQERYDFYTNFREELKAGTKDYRDNVAVPFDTRLVKILKDLNFMYSILNDFEKTVFTNRFFSSQEPFVKKQSSELFDISAQPTETFSPTFGFGLEYEELTYSIDFTIYEFDSEAPDYKGSLANGAELTYVDHYGDTHTATSDVNGVATLGGFRADTSYQVDIVHNGETTNLLFNYSENTTKAANWALSEEVILIKDDRKREPTEQMPISYNFDLAYEGGFFIDFSRTNELDNWTSRYYDEFETWSIIDDAGATGGKLLKHDTSQNIRRLFSFDPLWELWTDGQFGKRVWEDMEIVGKVKATVDTGNQNRLHVRSGYNIGDLFPIDNLNPTYSLVALLYKIQIDINFTVKDDLDSTLLESAEITLELDYGETKLQTTGTNGEASFLDEDSGTLTYNYEVTRPGYTTATGTFTVTKDTTAHNEEVLMTAI